MQSGTLAKRPPQNRPQETATPLSFAYANPRFCIPQPSDLLSVKSAQRDDCDLDASGRTTPLSTE